MNPSDAPTTMQRLAEAPAPDADAPGPHRWWNVAVVLGFALGYALLVTLLARFPARFFFDEVWYAGECHRSSMADVLEWRDHPPLGFALTCGAMRMLGEGPLAFRAASIAMGAGTVAVLLGMLARRRVNRIGLVLAGLLLLTDPLLVVLGRMSMLDTPLAFFFAVAVAAFRESLAAPAREAAWLTVTGLAIGLAMTVKWSGVFLVPAFALHYLVAHADRSRMRIGARYVVTLVGFPFAVFVLTHFALGFSPVDFARFVTAKILHHVAYAPMGIVEVASRSYEWLALWRPVAFMLPESPTEGYVVATGNPAGHLAALALVAAVLTGKVRSETARLATSVALVQWVAWAWAPRITFLYYLVTMTPFLAVEAAAELSVRLESRRVRRAAVVLVAAQLAYFAYLFPLIAGHALSPTRLASYRANPLLGVALPAIERPVGTTGSASSAHVGRAGAVGSSP